MANSNCKSGLTLSGNRSTHLQQLFAGVKLKFITIKQFGLSARDIGRRILTYKATSGVPLF